MTRRDCGEPVLSRIGTHVGSLRDAWRRAWFTRQSDALASRAGGHRTGRSRARALLAPTASQPPFAVGRCAGLWEARARVETCSESPPPRCALLGRYGSHCRLVPPDAGCGKPSLAWSARAWEIPADARRSGCATRTPEQRKIYARADGANGSRCGSRVTKFAAVSARVSELGSCPDCGPRRV
jgi:hypothetical protein